MRHGAAPCTRLCNPAETWAWDSERRSNAALPNPMNQTITLMMSGLAAMAIPLRVLAIALGCLAAALLAMGDAQAAAAKPAVAAPPASAPGAAAATPQAVVQALLQRHLKEDMGYTPASVARKAEWLTASLRQHIAAGFAKPVPDDEVPDIDGDPFTNSQDPPKRFKLEAVKLQGNQAEVPVRFSGNGSSERIRFLLKLEQGAWRIDDVAYEDGSTLRGLLP